MGDSYTFPIVVVAVEGSSDNKYLTVPLRAFFKERYGSDCKMVQVRDVTSDKDILNDDFLKELSNRIEDELKSPRYKIDYDVAFMIKEIVHIFDIDEAFIGNSHIYEDDSHEEFFYTREGIYYKSKQAVIDRNTLKVNRTRKLIANTELELFNLKIPYRAYYFSVNIDDFHFDNSLNLDDETKNKQAAELQREYLKKSDQGKIKKFKKIFEDRNPADYPSSYIESWDYVQKDNNSLNRCSNVYLVTEGNKKVIDEV